MPKRNFLNVKDFEDFFADEKQLIIDATEQAIQCPSDKEQQKECYSGKKKTDAKGNGYFNAIERNKIS
jgi:hypothetical protein